MLQLLQLSAPVKNNVIKNEAKFNEDYSPIQKKQPTDKNLDEFIKDNVKNVYNIFGHAAISAGYSFGKAKDSENTYFIDTDFSTTLFKDDISCEKYNQNFLALTLQTEDIIKLEAQVAAADDDEKTNAQAPLEKLKALPLPLHLEGTIHLNDNVKGVIHYSKAEGIPKIEGNDLTEEILKNILSTVKKDEYKYYIHADNDNDNDTFNGEYKFNINDNLFFNENISPSPNFVYNGIASIDILYNITKYKVYSSTFNSFKDGRVIVFWPMKAAQPVSFTPPVSGEGYFGFDPPGFDPPGSSSGYLQVEGTDPGYLSLVQEDEGGGSLKKINRTGKRSVKIKKTRANMRTRRNKNKKNKKQTRKSKRPKKIKKYTR